MNPHLDPQQIELTLERVLLEVERPARYIGGEYNSITKQWTAERLKVALCFPDIYDLGTPNLGLATLYQILNRHADLLAERVFLPWVDMEAVMQAFVSRSEGLPQGRLDELARGLASLEDVVTDDPAGDVLLDPGVIELMFGAEGDALRQSFADRAGRVVGMAAETFNDGLRAYYMSFAAVAWFFSPWAFLAGTAGVIWVLYRREFHSEVLAVLDRDLDRFSVIGGASIYPLVHNVLLAGRR